VASRLPTTRREKEIWQACEALLADRKTLAQITGDAIRDTLLSLGYKKGSPNEIYRYRKTWQTEAGLLSPSSGEAELCSALPDPIQRAASQLREEIFLEAQQEQAQLKEAFAIERTQYEQALEQVKAELQLKADALNKTTARVLHLEEAHAQELQLREELEAALLAQQSQVQTLNQEMILQAQALSHANQRHDDLMASLEQQINLVRKLAESERETLVAQLKSEHLAQIERQVAEQQRIREQMENQRHHSLAQLDTERTEKEKAKQQQERLAQELADSQAMVMAQTKQLADMKTAYLERQKERDEERQAWQAKFAVLEQEIKQRELEQRLEQKLEQVLAQISTQFQKQLQNQLQEQQALWLAWTQKSNLETGIEVG